MSRKTSARVAGFAFLIYIVVALTEMVLSSRATAGEGTAEKLASIARHVGDLRVAVVMDLASDFCALILAATLYAITRDEDANLALMVLVFRTAEGVIGGVSLQRPLGRLWLATASGAAAPDPAAANTFAAFLLKLPSWSSTIAASFFAVGSLVFAYLLLRGRIVPVVLAWIGIVASILAVVVLPLELAGLVSGPITDLIWLPMLAFEVPLGFWLIVKGAAIPRRLRSV
jgi:Domain of unknown function (DUF4386)